MADDEAAQNVAEITQEIIAAVRSYEEASIADAWIFNEAGDLVQPKSYAEWQAWIRASREQRLRTVARTKVGHLEVSTVLLTTPMDDPADRKEGEPPLIFETLVLPSADPRSVQCQYRTRREALEGHVRVVGDLLVELNQELCDLRLICRDACEESAMYEHGVKDAQKRMIAEGVPVFEVYLAHAKSKRLIRKLGEFETLAEAEFYARGGVSALLTEDEAILPQCILVTQQIPLRIFNIEKQETSSDQE